MKICRNQQNTVIPLGQMSEYGKVQTTMRASVLPAVLAVLVATIAGVGAANADSSTCVDC